MHYETMFSLVLLFRWLSVCDRKTGCHQSGQRCGLQCLLVRYQRVRSGSSIRCSVVGPWSCHSIQFAKTVERQVFQYLVRTSPNAKQQKTHCEKLRRSIGTSLKVRWKECTRPPFREEVWLRTRLWRRY